MSDEIGPVNQLAKGFVGSIFSGAGLTIGAAIVIALLRVFLHFSFCGG